MTIKELLEKIALHNYTEEQLGEIAGKLLSMTSMSLRTFDAFRSNLTDDVKVELVNRIADRLEEM